MAITVTAISTTNGPEAGGTAVGIDGAEFVDGCTVTFGGVAATSVVFETAEFVSCVTPAGTGLVDVVVTNPDLSTDTLVGAFTYDPPPSVTSVAPASGPAAGGTEVLINGEFFVGGCTVTFGGVAGAVIGTLADELTVTTPAGTGVVNVVVTNPDGGVGTLVSGFTYNPPPTVEAVSPSGGVSYGGEAVTVTGSAFVDGATVTIGGVACTSVVWVSATEITCATPAGTPGQRDVVVTNPDGGAGTLTGGFTYLREGTLEKLLPPGSLWNLEQDSELSATLRAMGDEFARVQARGADLIEETDPRTASETLAEWEQALGLPDELVTTIPATTAGRRVAVTQKYVARGGATAADYGVWCAACGYPLLSITRHANDMTRSGTAESGDTLSGTAWAYAITLTLDTPTAGALTTAQFEAVIQARTHSHITIVFTYT